MTAVALPSPLAAIGVVENDAGSRTLTVRLSERAEGYARLLWRQSHQALVRGREAGYRTDVPTVWASAPGAYRVAFALPGDSLTLRFHFPPGIAAYSELVSKPGLSAIVTMDRSAGHFLSVSFRNRGT